MRDWQEVRGKVGEASGGVRDCGQIGGEGEVFQGLNWLRLYKSGCRGEASQ